MREKKICDHKFGAVFFFFFLIRNAATGSSWKKKKKKEKKIRRSGCERIGQRERRKRIYPLVGQGTFVKLNDCFHRNNFVRRSPDPVPLITWETELKKLGTIRHE